MKTHERDGDASDEELLRLSQEDADAFGMLYLRYRPELTGFVRNRLPEEPDAVDDVVSQSFMNAYRSRASFSAGSVRSWLYAITRNVLVDLHRRRRPIISLEDYGDIMSREKTILDQLTDDEMAVEMHLSLAALPPPEDQIMALRLQGVPPREIATRLELSVDEVYLANMRAFRRLRKRQAGKKHE